MVVPGEGGGFLSVRYPCRAGDEGHRQGMTFLEANTLWALDENTLTLLLLMMILLTLLILLILLMLLIFILSSDAHSMLPFEVAD